MFKALFIFMMSFTFVFATEEAPKETKKIISSFSKSYQKALDSAQRSIDKETEKALKALEKELIKAKKKDLELVDKIREQIESIKSKSSLADTVKDYNRESVLFKDIKTPGEKIKAKALFELPEHRQNFIILGGDLKGLKDSKLFKDFNVTNYGVFITMNLNDHPGIIEWIKTHNLVLSNDFIKEKYPLLYEKGVKIRGWRSVSMKINRLPIENIEKTVFQIKKEYKDRNKPFHLDFWAFYQKAKSELDSKKK